MFKSGDLVTCIKEYYAKNQIFPVGTVFSVCLGNEDNFLPNNTNFWLPNNHFEKLIKESDCKSQSAMASFTPKFKKGDKLRRTKKYCDMYCLEDKRNEILIAYEDSHVVCGIEKVYVDKYTPWSVENLEIAPTPFVPQFKKGDKFRRNKAYLDRHAFVSNQMKTEVLEAVCDSFMRNGNEVVQKTGGYGDVWRVEDVEKVTFEPTLKKGDLVYRTKEYCKRMDFEEGLTNVSVKLTSDSYLGGDGIEYISDVTFYCMPISDLSKTKPFTPKIKKGDKVHRTAKQRREGVNCDEILIASEDSKLNDNQVEVVVTTKYLNYYWRVDDQIELVPFEPTYKKDDVLKSRYSNLYLVARDSYISQTDGKEYVELYGIGLYPVSNLDYQLYRPVSK